MSAKQTWDAELYEAKHSFVWQLGQEVLEMLAPQEGERILDVGCGTGQLTQKMADSGASVLGIDSSADMIGQARQNYPHLTFALQDATTLPYDCEFDAVFSNATLHWVLDAEAAVRGMGRALKPGGRLAVELGGHGNIRHIETAVRAAIGKRGDLPPSRTYFPTIGEYTPLLEEAGLEVQKAELFDRPTPLDGEHGIENWIRQFAWYYFEALPRALQAEALADALEQLRPVLLKNGEWFADYRRLRVLAKKNRTPDRS